MFHGRRPPQNTWKGYIDAMYPQYWTDDRRRFWENELVPILQEKLDAAELGSSFDACLRIDGTLEHGPLPYQVRMLAITYTVTVRASLT